MTTALAHARELDGVERAGLVVREGVGTIRLPDFLLGAALVFDGTAVPGIGLNGSIVAVLVAVVWGLARRPHGAGRPVRPYILAMTAALVVAGIVSLFAVPTPEASDWRSRLTRMAAIAVVAAYFGTGRLDIVSALKGLTVALVLNVPAYYLGLTPDEYHPYLTGFLGDKNKAGLYYAVVGLIVISLAERWRTRILLTLGFAAALWLTGSRTSMFAFALGIGWMLVAHRAGWIWKIIIGAGSVWLTDYVTAHYSQAGVFGDRTGTDWIRARITEASAAKVAASPWYGTGLGEAYVRVYDTTWFFHNSYWTLRIEGGVLLELVVVGVTVAVAVVAVDRMARTSWTARGAQAAAIALMFCAVRLGEVFLTVTWMLVLGYALALSADRAGPGSTAQQETGGTHARS